MDTKQIIIVRKDLNMRKGKIAAQAAHASMKVFFDLMHVNGHDVTFGVTDEMLHWMTGSFRKICVSVDSENELEQLYVDARNLGLPCSLIIDSGLTEFGGVPTKTCVAIGPDIDVKIDVLTKHLKLL